MKPASPAPARLSLAASAAVAATLGACAPVGEQHAAAAAAPRDAASRAQAVVYGDDDRAEVFEHPSEPLRSLAQQSIAAMMSSRDVITTDPNNVRLRANTLGGAYNLCDDELFGEQPTAASCSGTLIDDDLLLTAGHCVEGGCSGQRWVFNYFYEAPGELATITAADVFSCARVVVESTPGWSGSTADFAILQLDRPATPRFTPAPFNMGERPVEVGDSVAMIGFGSGLPAKIDSGGVVRTVARSTRNAFTATVDAFGGHSGSGVFDANATVVGILVSGQTDYVRDGRCNRVNTLSDSSSTAESVTYAALAREALCAEGWPSVRLCDFEPVCGDTICSPGEDDACPDDCETTEPDVPSTWICDPAYYAVGDDCDCACGAYDPDCDDASLRIVNCRRGQVCGGDGVCVSPGTDTGASDVGGSDAGRADAGPTDTGSGDAAASDSGAAGGDTGGAGDDGGGDTDADAGAGADAGIGIRRLEGCAAAPGRAPAAGSLAWLVTALAVARRRRTTPRG